MIAKQDLENIEKIKELLKPDDAEANTIGWNKVDRRGVDFWE